MEITREMLVPVIGKLVSPGPYIIAVDKSKSSPEIVGQLALTNDNTLNTEARTEVVKAKCAEANSIVSDYAETIIGIVRKLQKLFPAASDLMEEDFYISFPPHEFGNQRQLITFSKFAADGKYKDFTNLRIATEEASTKFSTYSGSFRQSGTSTGGTLAHAKRQIARLELAEQRRQEKETRTQKRANQIADSLLAKEKDSKPTDEKPRVRKSPSGQTSAAQR